MREPVPLTIGAGRSACAGPDAHPSTTYYVSIPSLSGQAARPCESSNTNSGPEAGFQSPHYRGSPLGFAQRCCASNRSTSKGFNPLTIGAGRSAQTPVSLAEKPKTRFQSPHYRGRPLGGRVSGSRIRNKIRSFNPLTIGAGRSAMSKGALDSGRLAIVSIPSLSGQAARLLDGAAIGTVTKNVFQSPHYRGRPLGWVTECEKASGKFLGFNPLTIGAGRSAIGSACLRSVK